METSSPRNLPKQSAKVRDAWISTKNFGVPNLTLDKFTDTINELNKATELVEKLSIQKTEAINKRNALRREVWSFTKRVRHSAKATFGDNDSRTKKFLWGNGNGNSEKILAGTN